ncbi:MAG: C40 family peptidase [Bacteroidota bacterium]|nr:C40 family peptidase [Bacteroidota bacterium]
MTSKQIFISILIIVNSFLFYACSGSDPRFKAKEFRAPEEKDTNKEFRFASEEAKEEAAEDDRKVDIPSVKDQILKSAPPKSPERAERDKVLIEVLSLIGTPYSYGGNDSDGIDCSSFSCQIFEKSFGIKLPRSTNEQYRIGSSVLKSELAFGDLVFFNTTGRNPSHVGVYLGDDLFAHASRSFGVTISSMQSTYYKKRYVGAKRVVE